MRKLDCMAVLRALAEPTRMRIIRLLMRKPLGVNDVSKRLGISQYNTSKHLRILRHAGLLDMETRGRLRIYGITADLARRLARQKNVLALDCCTFRFDRLPR